MRRSRSIFYSTMLLTSVHLLLRFAGTSFQVFLSRRIGEAGIGLLQLTLSVSGLALVAGMGGIRTAAMYLTAEELGRGQSQNVTPVLSGCMHYSIVLSGVVGMALVLGAPFLAEYWIGNTRTAGALQLSGAFLPVVCLCGVMSGYFTAAMRIETLAAVEIAEQLFSMTVTVLLLVFWAGNNTEKACVSVVFGTSLGACLTLTLLVVLRVRERMQSEDALPVYRRLFAAALPLAGADVVRSGINTTENLLVPKRLALYAAEQNAMAAFGRISGMVFPVMMFPACVLFALAELLIPELAACRAAGNTARIRHLTRRGLWAAMLYGVFFGGLMYLLAEPLCLRLYGSAAAGQALRQYSLMIPLLYCDAVIDAMTKGLGQQKVCVRYNILTSAMDVTLLFVLLPRCGMAGYYVSFLITHLLNFCLSLRRLHHITGVTISFRAAAMSFSAAMAAACIALRLQCRWLYVPLTGCLMLLLGVMKKEDIQWLQHMILNRFHTKAGNGDIRRSFG